MDLCVVTTFDCSFEQFKEMVDSFEDELSKCLHEWEIAKIDDHKAVALFKVADMEAFQGLFSTPKAVDFHSKHNLVDTFYSLGKLP
jgi:hypothetical protein